MRCACIWASSCGGVSHRISIFMRFFSPNSLAAASAPVRAARNTGFVELFAMTAMRRVLSSCARAGAALAALDESGVASFVPHARGAAANAAVKIRYGARMGPRLNAFRLSLGNAGITAQSAGGNASAPAVDDDGHDDRAADDDPFVVLIEMQRANGLSDEHDQERAERGPDRAALPPDQARSTHHRGRDDIQLIALPVAR